MAEKYFDDCNNYEGIARNPMLSFEEKFNHVMRANDVHNFTKEVIRKGVTLDAVDAYYDALLAVEILRARMDAALAL